MSEPAPSRGDVRITHVFDAPREAVFAAWVDPEQVARWWAPDGFEIPSESVEIEPWVGGRFHLTMVESSGSGRFPYRCQIVELSEPGLIVLQAEAIPEAGIEATLTRVVLEAEGERTRMIITSGPYTEEVRASAEAGWIDLIGNLERVLA